jgi:hypothetical protein
MIASTASRPPCTTLNTPSGNPASFNSAASFNDTEGSFSDGFSTKQLPHASATGIIHSGTMIGKLNGVIPATTPSGWRIDHASIPVPTWSVYSPFSRCGMPQANSTTSRPRCTSPSASDSTLPCSPVIISDISRRSRSSRSFSLNITRARRSGGVAAQAGQAAFAAATVLSTSDASAIATFAVTSPEAGLNTSPNLPLVPATDLPPIKCPISRMVVPPECQQGRRTPRRHGPDSPRLTASPS